MPQIMHTSGEVVDLFQEKAKARGLSLEKTPAAVQLAVQALVQGTSPFTNLIGDLPAESRAFEWMACAFAAYAEWCDHTIVVNDTEAPTGSPDAPPTPPMEAPGQ